MKTKTILYALTLPLIVIGLSIGVVIYAAIVPPTPPIVIPVSATPTRTPQPTLTPVLSPTLGNCIAQNVDACVTYRQALRMKKDGNEILITRVGNTLEVSGTYNREKLPSPWIFPLTMFERTTELVQGSGIYINIYQNGIGVNANGWKLELDRDVGQ